jgi:quercetin dioxygenase-like cupin family protein
LTPGAHTVWHTTPRGQTLYIADGIGYVARGGPILEVCPGDVFSIGPGEEHWHGATPDRFMAHISVQAADSSAEVVTWLDHVPDSEYRPLSPSAPFLLLPPQVRQMKSASGGCR